MIELVYTLSLLLGPLDIIINLLIVLALQQIDFIIDLQHTVHAYLEHFRPKTYINMTQQIVYSFKVDRQQRI